MAHREAILGVAKASIESGVKSGKAFVPDIHDYPPSLRIPAATFVTLHRDGMLRGCIGTLQAYQSLIKDVAQHAYAAAFQDSRFSPLTEPELEGLDIEVSVLTPAKRISFSSEDDLLQQLQQGEDGIILEYGAHRATFLPQVWDQLPTPHDFLIHLKRKAGLKDDFWDEGVRISRYHSMKIA